MSEFTDELPVPERGEQFTTAASHLRAECNSLDSEGIGLGCRMGIGVLKAP